MATVKLTEKLIASIEPPTDEAQALYYDTEQPGLLLVVGRTGLKTFMVRGWVAGKNQRIKHAIGVHGRVRDDGQPWSLVLAKKRARAVLGDMARGINPNEKRVARGAVTLRDGLELHVQEMRESGKREISIKTIEYDVTRLLKPWLDRPLAELTVEAVQRIKERGRKHPTQTNRLLAELSALWNTTRRLRRSTFTAENPIGKLGVRKYSLTGNLEPERPRVADDDLPEWLRRVDAMTNAVRRDLQIVALFTGLRDANVTTLRWETVDFERGGFVIPMSKTTPFTVPVSSTVMEILEARREENRVAFGPHGGDRGWIFPTLDRDGNVIAVDETKERRHDHVATPWLKHGPAPKAGYKKTGKRVLYIPGLHALRRTFLSVADDLGVPSHVQKLLSNHSFGGRDVHEDYLRSEWSRVAEWVGKINEAMWSKLGGRRPRKPGVTTTISDENKRAA